MTKNDIQEIRIHMTHTNTNQELMVSANEDMEEGKSEMQKNIAIGSNAITRKVNPSIMIRRGCRRLSSTICSSAVSVIMKKVV